MRTWAIVVQQKTSTQEFRQQRARIINEPGQPHPNPAADQYSMRSNRKYKHRKEMGQITLHGPPTRIIHRYRLGVRLQTFEDGRATNQTFNAIAVEGTDTAKMVSRREVQTNMTKLGMKPAIQRPPLNQNTSANPCSNCHIYDA